MSDDFDAPSLVERAEKFKPGGKACSILRDRCQMDRETAAWVYLAIIGRNSLRSIGLVR